MNKKRIVLLCNTLLLIPSLVFAGEQVEPPNALLTNILQAVLNALSWAGLALAVRNDDIYRYKVCNEWSK